MWLYLFVILILLIIIDIIIYNSLIFLRQKVEEAKSGIDVQLKRRHDLIPKLVEIVKQYGIHEQNLLIKLTEGRVSHDDITNIFLLEEKYPDLKANKNFVKLQEEISETEDHIAASRAIYNQNTNIYNTKLQSFPESLTAKLHGFTRIDLYKMK